MPRKRKNPAKGDPLWTSDLKPAPGELRILQAFVNTVDHDRGTDELASAETLAAWLERWGLVPAKTALTDAEVERAVAVREALRTFIAAGDRVKAAIVRRLDAVAVESPVYVRLDPGGSHRLEPAAHGFAGAFGRLLAIVVQARGDGIWPRLKICANPACRRAFYDESRSLSGRWCVKARCGNLINSRTFRRRHPNYYRHS